jgi:hypothetical protein
MYQCQHADPRFNLIKIEFLEQNASAALLEILSVLGEA